jgi:phage tail protein X
MKRLALLTVGFIGSSFVLLWTVGEVVQDGGAGDQVSRSGPTTFSLEPAMTDLSPSVSDPLQGQSLSGVVGVPVSAGLRPVAGPGAPEIRPEARPETLPETRPVTLLPETQAGPPVPETSLTLAAPEDDVIKRLRAMSYGIVEEMKKPVPGAKAAPVSSARAVTAILPAAVPPAAVPPAATQPVQAERSYMVQSGDSLPGIAFRFYGTTVAYLEILSANRDLLEDPSDLRAGMTLRIPDK